jgi:hypothetical protein
MPPQDVYIKRDVVKICTTAWLNGIARQQLSMNLDCIIRTLRVPSR